MPISLFHLLFSGFPIPPSQRKMNTEVGVQRNCEQLAAPIASKKPSGSTATPVSLRSHASCFITVRSTAFNSRKPLKLLIYKDARLIRI